MLGIVQDITHQKETEAALTQAKNMADQANSAKSDFLSSMSHELRTPLNAILGFGQLLDYSPKTPLSHTQKNYVDQILKGGAHLLELINEVLDLAKIEVGKLALIIEEVNAIDVILECACFINTIAREKNVTVQFNHDQDELYILADETRFKQVILNLLSNAVKYNKKDGLVLISIIECNDNQYQIEIKDTGFGISKDQQNDVFKPFCRLGQESSDIEGTGIGLTFTKEIIEKMNGSIGFESVESNGSCFWIKLPGANNDQSVASTLKKSPIDLQQLISSKATLLHIEDNPDNLKLIEMLIETIPNLSFISAHNAELGIKLAINKQPDIIVLDINLPGMNGFEALKKLKNNDKTRHIPVMALSANAMKNDIKKGINAGFLFYLTKPVNVNEFLNAIEVIIKMKKSKAY